MGYNSTIIIMNDALHTIATDAEFGAAVASAVSKYDPSTSLYDKDIRSGSHVNAASVVACHHADQTALIAIGGNYGTVLNMSYGYAHHDMKDKLRLISDAADAFGYKLVKK